MWKLPERHPFPDTYIDLDLYFHTKEGPVKIKVEAYVVKGMTTPFIWRNHSDDQYSLLVKQIEGRSFLEFGDSGWSLDIANSVTLEFIDEDGHAFKVQRISSMGKGFLKKIDHWQNQQIKQNSKFQASDQNVQSKVKIVIPSETCVTVLVLVNFPEKSTSLYVEKVFNSNQNMEDVYTAPDLLTSKGKPVLQVSNWWL